MCVCVSSHSFWTSSSLDVPAGVTQEEGLYDAENIDPVYLLYYWSPACYREIISSRICVCVCVFPFILDIKFVGRTSRGHTGGRSHRISHPPSFCGACLNFSREKEFSHSFPSSTVKSNFVY